MKKEIISKTTVHNFGTKPSDKQFIRSTADTRVYYMMGLISALQLVQKLQI